MQTGSASTRSYSIYIIYYIFLVYMYIHVFFAHIYLYSFIVKADMLRLYPEEKITNFSLVKNV